MSDLLIDVLIEMHFECQNRICVKSEVWLYKFVIEKRGKRKENKNL